jgi:hypothetical protein
MLLLLLHAAAAVAWQVLLVGDSGVGKTCLVMRFISDRFEDRLPATVGELNADAAASSCTAAAHRVELQECNWLADRLAAAIIACRRRSCCAVLNRHQQGSGCLRTCGQVLHLHRVSCMLLPFNGNKCFLLLLLLQASTSV